MPTTGDRKKDPFRGFRFKIELGSVIKSGGFRECSGLDASNDAVDYREGVDETTIRKMPGLKKFSNITLKRGITDDMDLWKWRKQVMDGDIEKARMNGSIILIDDKGDEEGPLEFRERLAHKMDRAVVERHRQRSRDRYTRDHA